MQHPIFLAELLITAALPILFLLRGLLDLRRDFLFLGVYLQFLLYVYVGPYFCLRGGSSADSGSYEWFGAWALGLCGGALVAAYMLSLRSHRRVGGCDPPRLEVSPRRFELLLVILTAFSFTFWMIAWSHDIILRRLGTALLTRQFTLRFSEFIIYRLYIESLSFLVALVVAGLVAGRGRLSWLARTGATLVLLSAYFFRTVNSRHDLALTLLIVLGIWAALSGGQARFWPRFVVGCILSAVLLLYSNSVTEKVRVAVGTGQSLWRAFSPFSPMEERPQVAAKKPTTASGTPPGKGKAESSGTGTVSAPTKQRSLLSESFLYVASTETPMAMRANGLDLIVQMKPALETRGFAWGRAWKVPAALVVLPVTNPAKARAYKLAYDITAKNYLMRHYTDLPDTDHVSCILTDAYGNFGLLGFVLVGAVLGSAFGFGIRTLQRPGHGALAVIALFFMSHLFQFEQEFVTALLLWVKELPVLLGVLLLNPFATGLASSPAPDSRGPS